MKLIFIGGSDSLGSWYLDSDDSRELSGVDLVRFNKLKLHAPIYTDETPVYIEAYNEDKRVSNKDHYKIINRLAFRYIIKFNGVLFRSDPRDYILIPDDIFNTLVKDNVLSVIDTSRS